MNNHSLVSADDYLIIEHRVLPLTPELTLRASADVLAQSAEPRGRKLPKEVKRPQTLLSVHGLTNY